MYDPGTEYQLLIRMGLVLALGFLVGVERGWSLRAKGKGKRTAGVRTFTLMAVTGGLWGILSEHIEPILLGFALLGFVVVVMTGYYQHAKHTGSTGLTTEMAAFVTFSVGVMVMEGYIILSVAVTILMVLILSIKPKLHKWVSAIETRELYSGVVFLIISAVVLPLLPNRGFGPWEILNPYKIWGMVVLIAGISYAGYFSMKYLGNEKGILFTAFTGSLVSSVAVTVTLGRFVREVKSRDMLITGVLIATFTALSRVLLWTAVFNPALMTEVGTSVLFMILVALLSVIWIWRGSERLLERKKIQISNPLQMSTALQFGFVLAVVMLLSEASRQWFGDPGIYIFSSISGMVDIDSISLSLLHMGGSASANALVVAAITNTLIKGAIFVFFAGLQKSWKLLIMLAIVILAAIPGLLFA